MKLNRWFLTAAAAFGAVVASAQNTNMAAPAAGPVTAAPLSPVLPPPTNLAPAEAAVPEAKPEAPKPKPHKPKKKNHVMPVEPPMSAVVKDEVVNMRGQPSFEGEVIGHLKKGDMVTVDQAITLGSREKDEPAKWDRIAMPTNHLVWVDSQFVDSSNQTVKAKKLNVRGGPSENYSVVARLEKGDAIVEQRKEKGWIAILPPTNAYAFVAAECLTMQPAAPPAAAAPPPPVVQVPAEVPPPAPIRTESAPPQAPPPQAPAPTPASQSEQELGALRQAEHQPEPSVAAATAAPAQPAASEPPRIVTREGFVHRAYNIQAPADYELRDVKTGGVIDFLQPPVNMNFKIYVGTRITVTGAEGLAPRWPRTPVLQVQSVDLIP